MPSKARLRGGLRSAVCPRSPTPLRRGVQSQRAIISVRSMAAISHVAVGARVLAGTSAAATSRDFLEGKASSCRLLNSRQQCFLYRGESSSSQHTQGWHLSKMASTVVPTTRTRVRGLEMGEVDLNVQRKRPLRPVVERFNLHHEKNVSEEQLKELGVSRWSKWDCGPGVTTFWTWKVDELVYVSKGSVEVVPDGCDDAAIFYAGDLVRFPKWFEANLTFDEDYEQYYKFFAYGD